MHTMRRLGFTALVGLCTMILSAGCETGVIPDLDDIIPNGNDNGGVSDAIEIADFATNTGGGGGIALRPSDGALFTVTADGLFGPIEEGTDVSTLNPIGATNLGDPDMFVPPPTQTVLAISEEGEFWIGTSASGLLARVPPEGGDAELFRGLLEGADPANIFPEAMVFVPDGFDGPDINPGDLLVGEDTTFSKLAAIDVATGAVVNVENPGELNRDAHHLAFGPDGTLYSSRALSAATIAGVQTIDEDGLPTPLPGTFRVSAHTFCVLEGGDLILDGNFRDASGTSFNGLFFWSADDEAIVAGLALPTEQTSEADELIIGPDGTIYLSLPELGKIVTVTDERESS